MSFSENKTCIDSDDLHSFLEAVGSEYEFAQGTLLNKSVSTRWDFAGAFSFVVTVVTTIGTSVYIYFPFLTRKLLNNPCYSAYRILCILKDPSFPLSFSGGNKKS